MLKAKTWLVISTMFPVAALAQQESSGDVKVGLGLDADLSVVFQFKDQINLAVGNSGMSLDYLVRRGAFRAQDIDLDWYMGGGGWVGWSGQFGVRMPFGLEWDFASQWDAFAQVSPELNYKKDADEMALELGAALGVRYQF